MVKDDFGGWVIQGRFTASLDDTKCINNASQGAEAIPLSSVQKTVYNPSQFKPPLPTAPQQKATANTNGDLYIGEYATYSYAKKVTMMAGMGFTLLPGGKYYDQDKSRGGKYSYDAGKATITFSGGFLDGQVGKKVKATGFWITDHVFCEPWR